MQVLPCLSMLAAALAASQHFKALLSSEHPQKFTSLEVHASDIVPASGKPMEMILHRDGSLSAIVPAKKSSKYVHIGSGKKLTLAEVPQTGFSLEDGKLAFERDTVFSICGREILVSGDPQCIPAAITVTSSPEKRDNAGVDHEAESAVPAAKLAVPAAKLAVPAAKLVVPEEKLKTGGRTRFRLVATYPGMQDAVVKKVEEHPEVFSVGGTLGVNLIVSFQDDGETLVDQDGQLLYVNPTTGQVGDLTLVGGSGSKFAIVGEHLVHDGKASWEGCPQSKDRVDLYYARCDTAYRPVLKFVEVLG